MELKKNFLELIKHSYPDFNSDSDSVEIEFEGYENSSVNFTYISVWPRRDGNLNMDEHKNLLYRIIHSSGAHYNWNGNGTTGSIKYNEGGINELSVYTVVCENHWGEVIDDIVIDDEELRKKFPANIEGSDEFNDYNDYND